MKLSDSLYYGAVKNADLSSESINSEITLLYDNNKDNVDNIALFSQDGTLKEAVPAARIKTNLDVTGDGWFSNALEKTENQHFSNPHVQYIFDGNESQYLSLIHIFNRGNRRKHHPQKDWGTGDELPDSIAERVRG